MSERKARSDLPGTARPVHPDEPRFTEWPELTRYDLLLAAIPLVMLCAAVVGHVVTVPIWASLSIGALIASAMVVSETVLHPPV